jgi:hypothetical protein
MHDFPMCYNCGTILPEDNPLSHRCANDLTGQIREALTLAIEKQIEKETNNEVSSM